MKRRTLALGMLAGSAALAGAGWALWRSQPPPPDADTLWTLRFATPDGGELVMARLRGRPLLVNFWATWCAPCIREMPALDRFHRAGHGVQVVGLAIDRADAVREFLSRVPVGFAIGIAGLEGSELLRRLGNPAGALPFSVLFSASGEVVRQRLGETSQAQLVAWARAL